MVTRVLPEQFKPGVLTDIWVQLRTELLQAKPGDIVQNPYADVIWPCDRMIEIPDGVECQWEGATVQHRTLRPFGQSRSDVTIVNNRHFFVPTGSPIIPLSVDFGWIEGPGIDPGTHVKLDRDRRGGTLEQDCVDGTGLPVVFTSQSDRTRGHFNMAGKDQQIHNAICRGPEEDPDFEWSLEAQHGTNFAGATNPVMRGIEVYDVHGDGFYPGASLGGRITTFLDAFGGRVERCARSAFSPVNAWDFTVDSYVFDDIGRTVFNIEPPNAGCKTQGKLKRSVIGKHQLYLLSSGGNIGATVGTIELSDCWMVNDDAPLRLVKGDAQHKRGPYFVLRNKSTYPHGLGASFPTPALIAIDNANTGSVVTDNKGFMLQPGRNMALVRHRRSGIVEVHGNDHEGGIEVGPWV